MDDGGTLTSPRTLLGHLLRWAELQPSAPFLRVPASGLELDYGTVALLVAGCARTLRQKGSRRSDRVYLALENDWPWVVGLLAAEAIGAVAVAGNTRLSATETAAMLRHCDPAVVLTDQWQAAKVPEHLADRTVLAAEIPSGCGDVSPGRPTDPAVLAYSSGTTGEPKAVLLSGGAVASSSATYAELFGSTPQMRTAVAVPLFHNTGFVDGLGHALVCGGAVDLMRRFDANAVASGLASGRYNFFIGVPTMLQRIAEVEVGAVPGGVAPWIAYGGAPMSRTTARSFIKRFPLAQMVNCYGLSEATSITHYLPAHMSRERWDTIGIVVPGTRDRIVDGELFVDSPTCMIGYWDGDILAPAPLERYDMVWLPTGDLVARDSDGVLRVLGRKDGLINRGGEKISPREVEMALCSFPNVIEAVVVGLPDRDLGSVPAAQVVLADGCRLDERALHSHLATRLADYKIPVCVVVVDERPRNANGKIHLTYVKKYLGQVRRAERA